ncbi:MAG TPA: hypothetical protein VIE89_31700 [Candidatus Binatia bacterium]|jgi:hypothetical protein
MAGSPDPERVKHMKDLPPAAHAINNSNATGIGLKRFARNARFP